MRLRNNSFRYIEYPQIGVVLFEKSMRAKRVIISVKSPSKIRVAVPTYISIKRAEKFVGHKLDWIEKRVNVLKGKSNALSDLNSINDIQKKQLLGRFERLAHKHNLKYNGLKLRKMKSRWGSCSAKNNISLNIGLVNLPVELQEYVILHELVHTKIKNHSSKYWKSLENILPNSRKLNRRLNQEYGLYDS